MEATAYVCWKLIEAMRLNGLSWAYNDRDSTTTLVEHTRGLAGGGEEPPDGNEENDQPAHHDEAHINIISERVDSSEDYRARTNTPYPIFQENDDEDETDEKTNSEDQPKGPCVKQSCKKRHSGADGEDDAKGKGDGKGEGEGGGKDGDGKSDDGQDDSVKYGVVIGAAALMFAGGCVLTQVMTNTAATI